MYFTTISSPVGQLLLAGNDYSLERLAFASGPKAAAPEDGWREDPAPFRAAIGQLNEYFAGQRREFDLPLAPKGTPFQQTVWAALRRIPYGETISYRELARRLGNPHASRAVGLANGSNPIAIIVPCHRVIGSNGKLTGFGGGLDAKRRLLDLEQGRLLW